MKGMGIIVLGFVALGMLTNNFYIAVYVFIGISLLSAVYGIIRGIRQTKEAKKEKINRKFEESIRSLRNNNYDARHKYCMIVTFDKNMIGIGSSVTKTSDDIEYLKTRAKAYMTECRVEIYENKSTYPNFEWVLVCFYCIK